MSDSRAPAGQTDVSLALSGSAFSPGVLNQTYVGTLDDPTADGNFFRQFHSNTFEAQGRTGGYYERADWSPASGVTIYFRYEGDIFNSTTSATGSWQDAVTYTQSQFGANSQNCTSGGFNCQALGFTSSDGTDVLLEFIQYNQCMAEIGGTYPSSSASTDGNQVATTLGNVAGAAITALQTACSGNGSPPATQPPTPTPQPTNPPTATPQPTPASYDFSIVSVRIQPNEKQDFNLTQAPLAQAKVNQKFVPAMYWTLRTNVPEGVPTRYQLAVREPNGQTKQIIDQTTTHARSADTYFVWVQGGLTLSVPGHYVFTWSVALNGVAKQGSTSIDILKKVVHRTIKRFAFVFNALHIQNNHGQNAQNFRPGDTVVISASYTVRNLKGTAPVIITKTLQTQIGGVWKPVSSSQESQDTASGTHFYKSSFQLSPGLTIPAIRIVVGISVASHLHVKKVIIHIIH